MEMQEIGLCWYQKGANNKWTYDLTDHLMVDLETIIALATMTYIGESNVYELHPGDEKVFNDFADESQDILLYILQGLIIVQKYICILMLMTLYEWMFFCVYILSLVYLLLQLYVYYFISQKITCIQGVFRVCSERTWFQVLMKGAPPEQHSIILEIVEN